MKQYILTHYLTLCILWGGCAQITGSHAMQASHVTQRSGPEVIKLFSCSTQLSMKFFLLINVKMPTIVGILTFMIWKNSILGLSEP